MAEGVNLFLEKNKRFAQAQTEAFTVTEKAVESVGWQALRLSVQGEGKMTFVCFIKGFLLDQGLDRVTTQPVKVKLYSKPPARRLLYCPFSALGSGLI